jgi:hypothetical protein
MKASMKLTEDYQQALLEIIKEMNSVFWGPDLKKCTEMLQEPILGAFDTLGAQRGACNIEALNEIKSILKQFRFSRPFYSFWVRAYGKKYD